MHLFLTIIVEYIPLENLLEPLAPIANQWRDLAAALEVPQEVITAINAKYTGNATDCCRDLLDWWSKKQTNVQIAWKVLTEALQKHGHEKISKSLAQKYLSSTNEENQTCSTVTSEPPPVTPKHKGMWLPSHSQFSSSLVFRLLGMRLETA